VERFIVIVEDDHLQEGPLEEQIRDAFPTAKIETVGTEQEFRAHLDGYRRDRPHVVVMDVMLRWADPSPAAVAPPPEVAQGGYQRAGIRCAQLMSEDPALRRIPVIYYTILERSDLERDTQQPPEGNTTYVRKSTDPEVLVRKIRELIRASGR
jgi:DNA-binding NarL/FixJ family response regulator